MHTLHLDTHLLCSFGVKICVFYTVDIHLSECQLSEKLYINYNMGGALKLSNNFSVIFLRSGINIETWYANN